jgi:Caspase domain
MKRAAIFIGVDHTGNAPVLHDAARGARQMCEAWGEGQGLEYKKLLTDEGGATVTAKAIKDAVKEAIAKGVAQLIVYFSGHGINRNRGEYWLLSGAPDDPQEAVNLAGSEDLARTCGIAHVIFISDACRTAADSILAGSVNGSEIFPNVDGRENPVDQFFACRLGSPANEVKDAQAAADGFKALYTEQLIPALKGEVETILDWKLEDGSRNGYIHPQPLATYLEEAMVERLTALGGNINQEPSARILSRDPAWISMIRTQPAEPAAPGAPPPPRIDRASIDFREVLKFDLPSPTEFRVAPRPAHVTEVSNSLVKAALENRDALTVALDSARQTATPRARKMVKSAVESAAPFGPTHQESGCGFKIQGAGIVEAIALGAKTEMSRMPADVVRVWNPPRPGTIVLLVFEDGSGTVLPAIPDFMCSMRMEGGELADVAYEPSEFTVRWEGFQYEAQDIRALRGIASASSRNGIFQLEGDNALKLARRMQMMKTKDPALAVYAAYAYNDLQKQDWLVEMNKYMVDDYGASLFDVAMLARALGKDGDRRLTMQSFAPLLAQGWAYLRGRGIDLPRGLETLPGMLEESLWTVFNPDGVKLLHRYIAKAGHP